MSGKLATAKDFNTLTINQIMQLNEDYGIEVILADGKVSEVIYPSVENKNR